MPVRNSTAPANATCLTAPRPATGRSAAVCAIWARRFKTPTWPIKRGGKPSRNISRIDKRVAKTPTPAPACALRWVTPFAGDASALATKLDQIATSPNVPSTGRLLIEKLQAILAGSRDPELAADPELHYQYAAEIQLLLEYLASH